jgi:hypothetical protein
MSATQVEDNRASGDDYWLYVVEHADDPDAATLHRIQHQPAKPRSLASTPAGRPSASRTWSATSHAFR